MTIQAKIKLRILDGLEELIPNTEFDVNRPKRHMPRRLIIAAGAAALAGAISLTVPILLNADRIDGHDPYVGYIVSMPVSFQYKDVLYFDASVTYPAAFADWSEATGKYSIGDVAFYLVRTECEDYFLQNHRNEEYVLVDGVGSSTWKEHRSITSLAYVPVYGIEGFSIRNVLYSQTILYFSESYAVR